MPYPFQAHLEREEAAFRELRRSARRVGVRFHPNPRLRQDAVRGRDDTVGLNTDGGWHAAANAVWTQDTDETFRWRVLVQETNGDAKSVAVKVQFNLNGAGYTDVTASTAIRWDLSGQFADDDTITNTTPPRLGSGTWVNGRGSEGDNIAPDSGSVSLAGSDETEFEFALRVNSLQVSDADTFTLRLVESDGTVFNAYGATTEPTITVNIPVDPIGETLPSIVREVVRPGVQVNHRIAHSFDLRCAFLFSEGAGTPRSGELIDDRTGRSHHGTLTQTGGASVHDKNEFGPAWLAQSSDMYFTVDSHPDLRPADQISLIAVVSDIGTPGASWGRILHKQRGSTGLDDWAIGIQGSTSSTQDGAAYCRFHIGGSNIDLEDDVDLRNETGPIVIIGTYDGAAVRLYVNGKLRINAAASGSLTQTVGQDVHLLRHTDTARQFAGKLNFTAMAGVGWSQDQAELLSADPLLFFRKRRIPQLIDLGFAVPPKGRGRAIARANAVGRVIRRGTADGRTVARSDAPGVRVKTSTADARAVARSDSPGVRSRPSGGDGRAVARSDGAGVRVRTSEANARAIVRADATPTKTARSPADGRGVARSDAAGERTRFALADARAIARAFGFPVPGVKHVGKAFGRAIARADAAGERTRGSLGQARAIARAHAEARKTAAGTADGRAVARSSGEARKTAAGTADARAIGRSNAKPLFVDLGVGRGRAIARTHAEPRATFAGTADGRAIAETYAEGVRRRGFTQTVVGINARAVARAKGVGRRKAGGAGDARGVVRSDAQGGRSRTGTADARVGARTSAEARKTVRPVSDGRGVARASAEAGAKRLSEAHGRAIARSLGTPVTLIPQTEARCIARAQAAGFAIKRSAADGRAGARTDGTLTRFMWSYDLIRGETRIEMRSAYIPAEVETAVRIARRSRFDPNGLRAVQVNARAWPPLRAYLRIKDLSTGEWGPLDLSGVFEVRFRMIDGHGNVVVHDQPAVIHDAAAGIVEYPWKADDVDVPGEYLGRWRVDFETHREKPIFFPQGKEFRIRVGPLFEEVLA
jgi:hypothetical protein